MDPRLEGQYPSRGAFQIAEMILKCLEPDPKNRPNMEQILEILEIVGTLKIKPKKDSKSNHNHAEQTPNHHHQRYNRSPLQKYPSGPSGSGAGNGARARHQFPAKSY